MYMNNTCTCDHVNAFIVNNSIPYLLGEYVDETILCTVDRALIKDEILIDTTESMRPVINISIDSIGKNASDGLPSIIGNTTRYTNLLSLINTLKTQLDGKFPVIKPGLIARVYYQLENNRTGQVIRTMVEDLQLKNRALFLDINKNDINDNAIITNYSDSMLSAINQFTQGTDQMILRITSIELCYDVVCNDATAARLQGYQPGAILASVYDNQYTGINGSYAGNWYYYDRFYHFDETGKDIILHDQEIFDRHNKLMRIHCAQIQVNRYFSINPCSRIVFRFSIWQNDMILVNNTSEIASTLGVILTTNPYPPCPVIPHHCNDPCHDNHNHCNIPGNDIIGALMNLNAKIREMDIKQNTTVNQLSTVIKELSEQVKELGGTGEIPDLPEELPTDLDNPNPPPCHNDAIKETLDLMAQQLIALQEQIKDLASGGSGTTEEPETPSEDTEVTEEPEVTEDTSTDETTEEDTSTENTETTDGV